MPDRASSSAPTSSGTEEVTDAGTQVVDASPLPTAPSGSNGVTRDTSSSIPYTDGGAPSGTLEIDPSGTSPNSEATHDPSSDLQTHSVHSTESVGTDTGDTVTSAASDTTIAPDCQRDERRYADTCYYFGSSKRTWESARDSCRTRGEGWDLVAIDDLEEHEWVVAQLSDDTWIGGFESDNRWTWSNSDTIFWLGNETGEAVDDAFTWWEPTEPDSEGNDRQCLRYSSDSGQWAWADMPCRREYRYACEQVN